LIHFILRTVCRPAGECSPILGPSG
jgi:hypothetical protein